MKRTIYIFILLTGLLYSCSKEVPISPSNTQTNGEVASPSMMTTNPFGSNTEEDDDITDPEKEDNEKANKKAKN